MIRQKMDSLSFELLSRMAHMMTRMTRMTHWLDSHDSLARSLSRPNMSIGEHRHCCVTFKI